MRSSRRTAVAGLGWVAAAVVATAIGMGGVRLIGDSLTTTPGGVLDQQDVARALAAPGSPSVSAPPTGPSASAPAAGPSASAPPAGPAAAGPTPTPARAGSTGSGGREHGFSSTGGSVVAGCRDGAPYLVNWSPNPGYRVTKHETESEHADVRFEGSGGRSEIRVTCSGDDPVQQQRD
jgi:hypothetical protein